jgi:hypothetical protein
MIFFVRSIVFGRFYPYLKFDTIFNVSLSTTSTPPHDKICSSGFSRMSPDHKAHAKMTQSQIRIRYHNSGVKLPAVIVNTNFEFSEYYLNFGTRKKFVFCIHKLRLIFRFYFFYKKVRVYMAKHCI